MGQRRFEILSNAKKSIAQAFQRSKESGRLPAVFRELWREAYVISIFTMVSTGAFLCGRLSVKEMVRVPIRVENIYGTSTDAQISSHAPSKELLGPPEGDREVKKDLVAGSVVGSKNSTKYHFPWCSGARAIKEENKVWFKTEEEARAAGYIKAANCQ